MRKTLTVVGAVVVALWLVALVGCVRVPLPAESNRSGSGQSGAATHETLSAQLGDAKRVDATVKMGVGDLRLRSLASSSTAFTGTFTYAPASWKPEFETTQTSTGATPSVTVSVVQPDASEPAPFSARENSWDLKLVSGVPTDLSLRLGVGMSDVDLHEVDVRVLDVTTGVGETTLDLSGPRTADVAARVEAGVGAVKIRLPQSVGVRVTGGKAGVGDLSSDGFTQEGDSLVNAAYSQPGPKIELDLTRGVGSIKLELVQ